MKPMGALRRNKGTFYQRPARKKSKESPTSVILLFVTHNCPHTLGAESKGEGGGVFSWSPGVADSQTYSLVLLGGPEREPAIDGYLDTCFFRGQEAANMAPPRTSRREPPHAMKMAAPNSNLGHT